MNQSADATAISMEVDKPAQLASLEERIKSLTGVYNEIHTLRQIPSALLRPPPLRVQLDSPAPPRFQDLHKVNDLIKSPPVQDALRVAQDSEKNDQTGLTTNARRNVRKRRRTPSPDTPRSTFSLVAEKKTVFPATEHDPAPLSLGALPAFIRKHNRNSQTRLHVWTRSKPADLAGYGNPVIVRFTIRDVLTVFITLSYRSPDTPLISETITAFGPREMKSPHSGSDFGVYQALSQQMVEMIRMQPFVCFQSLADLMGSYQTLFVERCEECERVLSTEGHIPPVCRVWKAASTSAGREVDSGHGHWIPRHVNCHRE